MSTQIAIGFSNNLDPVAAFKEAAAETKRQLNLAASDLCLFFFTAEYASLDGLATAQRILQPMNSIGSMTCGLITPRGLESRGVMILSIVSSEMQFSIGMADSVGLSPLLEAGLWLARKMETETHTVKRTGMLYFINGINKNNSVFIQGLQEGLGRSFNIVGALGASDPVSRKTAQIFQNQILTDAAAGVTISGSLSVHTSAYHGWRTLGKPRIIDEAKGNIIRLIDNKPAISLYEDYFKEELSTSEPAAILEIGLRYPLGISTNESKVYTLRHPIEVLSDGSIVCQGEARPGARVHLMIADKDSCRHTAHDAAGHIREKTQRAGA